MQLSIIDAGPLRKKVTINYSRDEVQARRVQVLRQLGGEVKLNGFRPGKTSNSVVEKRYGEAATARVEELLADEALNKAVKEHQLKPVGPIANEEVARADGFSLVLSFDIKPAIALPDPTSLGLVDATIEVGDADVDQAVASLAKRAGSMAPLAADQTIIEDDSVTLDGRILVDGHEVKALKDFHHLVGGYPLFGLTPAQVIGAMAGKKAGDTLSLESTLPTTFVPAEQAGKSATIELTMTAAQRLVAATIDDELAKRMGVESLAALREMLSARLKSTKETQARQAQVQKLTEQLLATVQVEVPPKLLESALANGVEQAVKRAEQEGKSGADLDKARAEAVDNVTKGVRRYLIMDAIIESRKISVTREDLEDQIRMAAGQTGRKPEEIAKQLQSSGQVNQVVQEIREAKAIEVFLDEALGRPVPAANPTHGELGHVHGPDCQH